MEVSTGQGGGALVATGVDGLDEVLGGGLPRGMLFVVEGTPGAGKTTLGLQFALAGKGEPVLYISLSETEAELRDVAASHGWTLDGVELRYLSVDGGLASPQSMLDPGEVYFPAALEAIRKAIEETSPSRVVIDSLSELRLVAMDSWRFRIQLAGLKNLLARKGCTTLLLDNALEDPKHLRTLATGVIRLVQSMPDFGPVRRRVNVPKMRALECRTGFHDFRIVRGGLRVFPRLAPPGERDGLETAPLSSGLEELDTLLGGGLDPGLSVLLWGPAGVGKTLVASQYVATTCASGSRVSVYLFDERYRTYFQRARSLGLDLTPHVEAGRLNVQQLDPAEMSPGEFLGTVERSARDEETKLVVIDSLDGFLHAMPNERYLILHLHELLTCLSQLGVTPILTMPQHGAPGSEQPPSVDVSYIADTVVLFRYFEHGGAMRRAISVYKRRTGQHERLIRELWVDGGGVRIGEPLRQFRGVLTGIPEYTGRDPREEER